MHIVDINDKFKDEKHQIGMWRGDMADSRQYRFAFINSDRRPIPVPPGVHIYGVPRPDGSGSALEVLSIERACGAEAADIRSEVFVAPEGAVYRVTGLGEVFILRSLYMMTLSSPPRGRRPSLGCLGFVDGVEGGNKLELYE